MFSISPSSPTPCASSGALGTISDHDCSYLATLGGIRERRRSRPSIIAGFERALAARHVDRFVLCGSESHDAEPGQSQFERARSACLGRWLGLSDAVRGLPLQVFVDALESKALAPAARLDIELDGDDVFGPEWEDRDDRVAGFGVPVESHILDVDRRLCIRMLQSYYQTPTAVGRGFGAAFDRARSACTWHLLIAAYATSVLRYSSYLSERARGFVPFSASDGLLALEPPSSSTFPISGFQLIG